MGQTFTWVVFLLTYAALALGRVPWLRIDRTGIALVGATIFLLAGVVTLPDAIHAINFETLLLLFGMMVLVAHLRLGGFFERVMSHTQRYIRTPHGLLAAVITLSGVLSAFLINDVVCVALTPLVIRMARLYGQNPLPHLLGLATASNIGSVATIIGNPQNIIIGANSGIGFAPFCARLAPVAVLGLLTAFLLIALIYRRTLTAPSSLPSILEDGGSTQAFSSTSRRGLDWLLIKSVMVTLVTICLFFTAYPKELVALGAAAFMLLGRVRPDRIYRQVDWPLLLMFAGLFVVVDVFNTRIVTRWGIDEWSVLLESPIVILSVVSAVLSNLVSNVPAVMLFQPIILAIPHEAQETAWLALAMSSTLAGNLTVLGSVANLIVIENARRDHVAISFWEYCRVGIPLTLLTLALGIAWLLWTQ